MLSDDNYDFDMGLWTSRRRLHEASEPAKVGRFILLGPLGAGAMGEVHAAYDDELDRRVAIKLVSPKADIIGPADELLRREAQALARVSHPNVVQVYETGTHHGRLFIAMELVRGKRLSEELAQLTSLGARRRRREILRRFIAAGRGLEAAHQAGVAHRDFKPDNVIVGDDGRVRVVDFGLARATSSTDTPTPDAGNAITKRSLRAVAVDGEAATLVMAPSTNCARELRSSPNVATEPPEGARKATAATPITLQGALLGTLRYMAPEQLKMERADQLSDQFSFCVSLYRALYGQFPFAGDSPGDLIVSMSERLVCEKRAGVPRHVRRALARGLSVAAPQRFPTMGELLAALEPPIRRATPWLLAAAILLVLLSARLSSRAPEPPCERASSSVAMTWSSLSRAVVATTFARSGLPYAGQALQTVSTKLDGYVTRWRATADQVCHATYVEHVQSAAGFDRRMACLQYGRAQLAALVSELSTGNASVVQKAVEAAEKLPDLAACNTAGLAADGMAPPSQQMSALIAEVREQLARVQALNSLGRNAQALAIARRAVLVARATGYAPVEAEALFHTARSLDETLTPATNAEAQALYLDALDLAEGSRHDTLVVAIWNRLVFLAIRGDVNLPLALERWRRNEAAVRRTGNAPLDSSLLHHLRASIYYAQSEYAASATEERAAIALLRLSGERPVELSAYDNSLARAVERQGLLDEALRYQGEAVELVTSNLGATHPRAIRTLMNDGDWLSKAHRFAEARAVFETAYARMSPATRTSHMDGATLQTFWYALDSREVKLDGAEAHARAALEIYLRIGAPEALIADAYMNLGNVETLRKHYEASLALYRQAYDLRRRTQGAQHYLVGVVAGDIAEALIGLARYAEAEPYLRMADDVFRRSSVRDTAEQAWLLMLHGEAALGRGAVAQGIDFLEQAVAGLAVTDVPNAPQASWDLARALQRQHGDPPRIRQLAERARDGFVAAGPASAADRAAVELFLATL